MSSRTEAIDALRLRELPSGNDFSDKLSEAFGAYVFNRSIMQKMLPKVVYLNVLSAMEGHEKIKPEYGNVIAVALKDWAISHGATHYSHWFHPLTGAAAEKHDAFIDWNSTDQVIEKFSVNQLIQGEPDASSFPSGGLRSTFEARGYTGWDPTSPPFLWSAGNEKILCIPSVYFSWAGHPLDSKIPLLRSDRKIKNAVLRLLKFTGIPVKNVFSTVGLEQEYFIIDRNLHNLRPDLLLSGRTVFGAPSPKGQELQDHYFGSLKDRIIVFMGDFESAALKLGIPIKTRHNEVAPAQHEMAPIFSRAPLAVDQNILLMELMRQTATAHGLSCLLHDKPFQGLNGSGKHCNWSLSTDTGLNLLDPSELKGNNLHFPILMTAILKALHKHSALLRSSIGSAGNDHRLGGHEAPPVIISAYLGTGLENLLDAIEHRGKHEKFGEMTIYDLGLPHFPDLKKEETDRNRTSPFAFVGTKFEFRALGASQHPAFPITVLNAIISESLHEILDEIEASPAKNASTSEEKWAAIAPVLSKNLKASRNVRFGGDNYSKDWALEAGRRNLPNLEKSIYAFEALLAPSTIRAFDEILTEEELLSRYEVFHEAYSSTVNIEANLMLDLFQTSILPVAIKQQKLFAESLHLYNQVTAEKMPAEQMKLLKELTATIEEAISAAKNLSDVRREALTLGLDRKGYVFCEKVIPACQKLRRHVDHLETLVEDSEWPLPKYRELLFLV